jgi:hypothetical protein
MIRITVQAGKNAQAGIHELCSALSHARVWHVSDRRRTKHLHLVHSSGTVKGSVRRVKAEDRELLTFDCSGKDEAQEAITAGRFVNLVLRDLHTVSDISIHRR